MNLGKTGKIFNPIGLGVYALADRHISGGKDRLSTKDAVALIHWAVEQGINFIDTANVYCYDDTELGYGERIVRDALKNLAPSKRDQVIVATKGIMKRPGGSWQADGSPAHMRKSCEQSLKDLGVEAIDLYQVHGVDSKIPLTETVGELFRLQKEGKIKHIGLSNVSSQQIKDVLALGRIEAVQNKLNPFVQRDLSNGVLDLCGQQDLTYLAYSPVGGSQYQKTSQVTLLNEIAIQYACSPYQVALSWILNCHPRIAVIPSSTRKETVISSQEARKIKLSQEHRAGISHLAS
ncbi:MAG: aldo/keto reductase [Oligoflexales bacterium]|nr:aldo/keto reductase [Oligoflexales bacterium]